MKTDIDRLMEERNLDAMIIFGPGSHNPAMVYFTGTANLTEAYLIKKRGQTPVLFHSTIERDEAALSGLPTKNLADYSFLKLLEDAGGDRIKAGSRLLQLIFNEYAVSGRVAVYGRVEIGPFLSTLRQLEQDLPGLEVVGEPMDQSVLMTARTTKSPQEVERIRQVGQATTAVMAEVATFLTSHKAKQGVLVDADGKPLTIGEVKRRVNLWLALRGVDNPESPIFAAGREAAVGHSTGTDTNPVPVGEMIIFDLFPCERGGGYFYDCTRTWCVGHATDRALDLYEQVQQVYQKVMQSIQVNGLCRDYQLLTCQLFAQAGHPTVMENEKTQDGYTHSLGHGVGLAVHEAPGFVNIPSNEQKVLPGSVFSVEPGLYYPERGLAARIEDTVWMRPDGKLEILADLSTDLVLKLPAA